MDRLNYRSLVTILIGLAVVILPACENQSSEELAQTHIVGGHKVSSTSPVDRAIAKSTVALTTRSLIRNKKTGNSFCTGVLISRQTVLTAAHCLYTKKGSKFYRKFTFTRSILVSFDKKVVSTSNTISARRVYLNSDWLPVKHLPSTEREKLLLSDLAIIKLSRSAPSSHKPAYLAKSSEINKAKSVHMAGFGHVDEITSLGGGELYSVDTKSVGLIGKYGLLKLGNGGAGACTGDSGGPAYLFENNRLSLVGIASFGKIRSKKCAGPTYYGYTPMYANWINKYF